MEEKAQRILNIYETGVSETELTETLKTKINASTGGSLGSIKPTGPAPTPARNGNYTFSIGGAKPAWLTAEAGITTVKAGDGVAVVYTAPSSYTYTHINVNSNFETFYSKYPYKQTQVGANIPQLIKAVKNVFINPDIVDPNKRYSISSVRRNNIAQGKTERTSQVTVWSRNNSDGAISLVKDWTINGDAANGSNQILDSTNVKILINWDALPDDFSVGNMISPVIGNYELDAMCFDKRNVLYKSPQPVDLSKNDLVYSKPNLIDGYYVDTRSGNAVASPVFGSTDYIPVYPGQIIRYVGGMFGNAGICGYSTKSITGYVVLHNSNIETNNSDFEFTIPVGVNFIRACCHKPVSTTVELYYYKSYNYALFANIGISDNIEALNILFKGGQVEAKTLVSDTEKQKVRWIELKENYDFPSKGVYIGRQDDDVVICINGVTTKLN